MPELVEKKEPPIIVKIKKIKEEFSYDPFKDIPIFEILLLIDKNVSLKLLELSDKKKNNRTTIQK